MTYFEAERRLDKAIIMMSFLNVGDIIRICHIIYWILYWIYYQCAALRGTDSRSEEHHCSSEIEEVSEEQSRRSRQPIAFVVLILHAALFIA